MFSELSQVMDHAIDDDSYLESLNENVANKRTKVNKDKTTGFIKQLYDFKPTNAPFAGFKYFWQTRDGIPLELQTIEVNLSPN